MAGEAIALSARAEEDISETAEATTEADPVIGAIPAIAVIVDASPHMETIMVADIPAEDGRMEHRMAVVMVAVMAAVIVS